MHDTQKVKVYIKIMMR